VDVAEGIGTVVGRSDIRPRYVTLFEQYDPAISGEIERIEVCGDVAVVSGRNGGWFRGRGGRPDRRLSDVYVMVLRLEPEGWRIARLIWHSDGGDQGDGRTRVAISVGERLGPAHPHRLDQDLSDSFTRIRGTDP
jgi:hypothetical protein